jgi:Tol biopolymer transport system component/DNA-binding winged helix-turn-helix (wHTH) protein
MSRHAPDTPPATPRPARPAAEVDHGRAAEASFELCGWTLQPRLLEATRASVQVRVEPRLMQLLACLHAARGAAVTRERIMHSVWGHAYVTEDALNRLVSRLRRLLANELACDATIETIPKVGYKLVTGAAAGATRAVPAARPRRRWWAGAATLVALAAAALWLARGAAPAPSVLMDPQRRTMPLTSMPGHEIQATLAPDGRRLAFAHRSDPAQPWDIYVRDVGSDALLRVTAGDGDSLRPAWSPDGHWIAFLRVADTQCELRLVAPIGGPTRVLAPCDATLDEDLAWTPDSAALVFRAPGARGLSRLPLEGGPAMALTAPPAGDYDALPVYAPEGRLLAFARWHNFGVADVYVQQAVGPPARRVTFDNLKVHGLAWDPDGEHLVYSSNRGGGFGLWRTDLQGSPPQAIPVAARTVDGLVISRDGRRMVYEEWRGQANVFTITASAARAAPLAATASTRWDWNPQPTPDGARFAFVSDRSGAAELWLADAAGGPPQRLTSFDGPYVGAPAWSPDLQRIAFESPAADGNFDLYEVALAGGALQRLTNDPAPDRFPHYTPDGRALVYTSRRSGDWQIWRLDLTTHASVQLTRDGGYYGYADADGTLYYARSNEGGLWRLPSDGAASALAIAELQPIDCANWTLQGGALWYVQRDPQEQALLAEYDIAGGVTRVIAPLPRLLYKSGLGVDARGSAWFTAVVSSETDLMLAETAR